MKKFYPVFLDMEGKKAVVIGGGPVAARKAGALAKAGAEVTLVSPALDRKAAELVSGGGIEHTARRYRRGDLAGAFLAVAATDEPDTNLDVASEAKSSGILVNCVRPPSAGSFIVPSSIRRGGLTVAISTGGGCPALSKRLKKDIDALLGREYGPFLAFLEDARAELKARLTDEDGRAEALTALVESDLIDQFRAGRQAEAAEKGRAALDDLIARLQK